MDCAPREFRNIPPEQRAELLIELHNAVESGHVDLAIARAKEFANKFGLVGFPGNPQGDDDRLCEIIEGLCPPGEATDPRWQLDLSTSRSSFDENPPFPKSLRAVDGEAVNEKFLLARARSRDDFQICIPYGNGPYFFGATICRRQAGTLEALSLTVRTTEHVIDHANPLSPHDRFAVLLRKIDEIGNEIRVSYSPSVVNVYPNAYLTASGRRIIGQEDDAPLERSGARSELSAKRSQEFGFYSFEASAMMHRLFDCHDRDLVHAEARLFLRERLTKNRSFELLPIQELEQLISAPELTWPDDKSRLPIAAFSKSLLRPVLEHIRKYLSAELEKMVTCGDFDRLTQFAQGIDNCNGHNAQFFPYPNYVIFDVFAAN